MKVALAGEGACEVGLRFLHRPRRQLTIFRGLSASSSIATASYGVSGRDHEDNDKRFALFSLAALEGAKAAGFKPDIVHASTTGRPAPSAPISKRQRYANDPHFAKTGTVFTVHNMAYQGQLFPRAALEASVKLRRRGLELPTASSTTAK